jgi:NAD(P)H dehydrogenase (quinone)
MNVLIIYAHPEPNSLNGFMKDLAAKTLRDNGHKVKISDLYGMKFKATLDQEDFSQRKDNEIFNPIMEQINALGTGSIAQDIKDEVEKIKWADLLIFQFPVWWTSLPAILKGWIDRVFLPGVVHNIAEGKLYETGLLKGKKAMLSYTTGATRDVYTGNGPHGDINDLFKYITHNILELTGLKVVPSFGIYGSVVMSKDELKIEINKFKDIINSL